MLSLLLLCSAVAFTFCCFCLRRLLKGWKHPTHTVNTWNTNHRTLRVLFVAGCGGCHKFLKCSQLFVDRWSVRIQFWDFKFLNFTLSLLCVHLDVCFVDFVLFAWFFFIYLKYSPGSLPIYNRRQLLNQRSKQATQQVVFIINRYALQNAIQIEPIEIKTSHDCIVWYLFWVIRTNIVIQTFLCQSTFW